MTQAPGRRAYVIGLAAAVAALIAVNGYYFSRSHTPTYWDDSHYLTGSLTLYDALIRQGIRGFATVFAHLFGDRAPLISVFPIPVYLLFGRGCDPRFLVSAGFLVVMSVYLFRMGEKLWSPKEGLLAVAILQTMPVIYGLSRQFLVEYGLATIVVMWMYYLLCFRPLSHPGTILRLGVLLGAGLLMKVTFPMYVLAPTLVMVWFALRGVKNLRDGLRLAGSLAGVLVIGAAVAGSWYLFNWRSILGFAVSAGFGKIAVNYGDVNILSPAVVWEYVAVVMTYALSCYYSVLSLFLVPIWAFSTWPRLFSRRPGTIALWLWMIVPFAITLVGVSKDPRYLAPIMPAFALGLAHIMTGLFNRRPILRRAEVVLLIIPILAYAIASLPALGVFGEFKLRRWVFWSPHLYWYASVPDSAGAWGQSELAEMVCRDAHQSQRAARLLIPLQHRYMNNENFTYFFARLGCDVQAIGIPGIQHSNELADWMHQVKPAYVFVVPQVPDPDLAPPFANVMKEEAEQMVTRPDSGFQLMYRGFLGTTGKEILIYRSISNRP